MYQQLCSFPLLPTRDLLVDVAVSSLVLRYSMVMVVDNSQMSGTLVVPSYTTIGDPPDGSLLPFLSKSCEESSMEVSPSAAPRRTPRMRSPVSTDATPTKRAARDGVAVGVRGLVPGAQPF